jgi:hypothetical protein
LIPVPIADPPGVNVCESKREQTRIIRRQFRGKRPLGAIFRGALLSAVVAERHWPRSMLALDAAAPKAIGHEVHDHLLLQRSQ